MSFTTPFFFLISAISTSALLAVTQTFPLCFTAFGFRTILWLGSSLLLVLIGIVILTSYVCALFASKRTVIFCIMVCLGLLGFFKYRSFLWNTLLWLFRLKPYQTASPGTYPSASSRYLFLYLPGPVLRFRRLQRTDSGRASPWVLAVVCHLFPTAGSRSY